MSDAPAVRAKASERGSALVLALLVAFILSLLGASFLMMAGTESHIARNEQLAAQALYAAEAGATAVKAWFDRPGAAVDFPTPAEVDRGQRQILDEADPYGTVLGTAPLYKENIDQDGDGADDLFDRPYRGDLTHTLMGTEQGPDMVIDDSGSPAELAFLDRLSSTLFGRFPAAGSTIPLRAQVARVAVYAPPYVSMGASWGRYGMGTVKVTARIYSGTGTSRRTLAEQTVKAVLAEIPYGLDLFGPLHSCGDIAIDTTLGAHWGTVTAAGAVTGFTPAGVAESIPRDDPPIPRLEEFWTSNATAFGKYEDDYGSPPTAVPDPWLRLFVGEDIDPNPPAIPPSSPPYPDPASGDPCCDLSNVFQSQGALVECPTYDYDFWKRLATSRGADVHYFTPHSGRYQEDGTGIEMTFQEATEGREGLFFFETLDGRAPHDDDADGVFENLMDHDLTVQGSWSSGGFIFLNARRLVLALDAPTMAVPFVPPGEPFLDLDSDGEWDDPAEPWINLLYPTTLAGAVSIHATDAYGGGYVWNRRGKPLTDSQASFHGILYSAGVIEAPGSGVHYGSVIAGGGLVLGPSAQFYWDASIGGSWPPVGMRVPRVVITGWDTQP